MNTKWRELDLGGEGLQAANLRLARLLRRRATAWGLLLLFPTGAHCWYLREPLAGSAYLVLTVLAGAIWLAAGPAYAWSGLAVMALLLVRDALTLENRIVACNKKLRTAIYLSQGAAAPPGFRGRHTALDDAARVRRMPTFAEQEALLREITARKNENSEKPG